jgi:hypothetical protein
VSRCEEWLLGDPAGIGLDLYARSKDREFASITKRWDIDWFWKLDTTGPEHDPLRNRKELYALNLVNADTEQQLWAYL